MNRLAVQNHRSSGVHPRRVRNIVRYQTSYEGYNTQIGHHTVKTKELNDLGAEGHLVDSNGNVIDGNTGRPILSEDVSKTYRIRKGLFISLLSKDCLNKSLPILPKPTNETLIICHFPLMYFY